jgi:hypothetical protein
MEALADPPSCCSSSSSRPHSRLGFPSDTGTQRASELAISHLTCTLCPIISRTTEVRPIRQSLGQSDCCWSSKETRYAHVGHPYRGKPTRWVPIPRQPELRSELSTTSKAEAMPIPQTCSSGLPIIPNTMSILSPLAQIHFKSAIR